MDVTDRSVALVEKWVVRNSSVKESALNHGDDD